MGQKDLTLLFQTAIFFCLFFIFCSSSLVAEENKYKKKHINRDFVDHYSSNDYRNRHFSKTANYDSYEDYLEVKKYRNNGNIQYQKNRKLKKRYKKLKISIINYKVKKGDTLTRISKKYNISISKIIKLNRIQRKNNIYPGKILKLPVSKKFISKNKRKNIRKATGKVISPSFKWPLKKIVSYKSDGINGVKSIGILIKTKPGSFVYSSAPGTVKKIGVMRGFGRYIVVMHKGRFLTVYSNISTVHVSEGMRIKSGTKIGKMNKVNAKLHFQIDYAGKPKNPLNYLPKKG